MEIGIAAVIAVVVGPFVIGWWIGHPLFAAAVFVALALTVALGVVTRGEGGDPGLGLAFSLAVSAVSASVGGQFGARRRTRRASRR